MSKILCSFGLKKMVFLVSSLVHFSTIYDCSSERKGYFYEASLWRVFSREILLFQRWFIAKWVIAPNFVSFGALTALLREREKTGSKMKWRNGKPMKMANDDIMEQTYENKDSGPIKFFFSIFRFQTKLRPMEKSVVDYEWPPSSNERWVIQEQFVLFLDISGFKRKYPKINRRQLHYEEVSLVRWSFFGDVNRCSS